MNFYRKEFIFSDFYDDYVLVSVQFGQKGAQNVKKLGKIHLKLQHSGMKAVMSDMN